MKQLLHFPSPYTVLMIVIVLAAAATWLLPAGVYHQLSYDGDKKTFTVATADSSFQLPGTQASLDQLGVQIPFSKFEEGKITKPVAVPGTYAEIKSSPQGALAIVKAPIQGVYEAVDVILFVLIIGGYIGVMKASGMFEAGIQSLARRLKGRESWLIIVVMVLIGMGGTSFGMAEETLAFYPILVPVFLAAGYDALVPMAVIYVGSSYGCMFSTTNPFATIIASDAAGVSWSSGLEMRLAMLVLAGIVSIWYVMRYAAKVKANPESSLLWGKTVNPPSATGTGNPASQSVMDGRKWLLALFFLLSFVAMVFGVSKLGWWFPEMTTLFLVAAIITGFLMWQGEKPFIQSFIKGAEEMLGVAFIIGIARGVTIVLSNGQVSGTMLHYASNLVDGMPAIAFLLTLLAVFTVLTIFVSSSSGMAVLTMPILAPLAGVVGVPAEQVVNTYLIGFGLMSFITPTGLALPSLAMVDVDFGVWLRFSAPLLGILVLMAAAFLIAATVFG